GASTEIVVTIDVGASVRVDVRDDGVGFDPAGRPCTSSFGLVSMEERALSLGGHLTIESAPGQGTVVRFECPALPRAVDDATA
ncbi:MAG: ATP-binding protein, partial [Candidatus Binatia bacterium]